MPPERKHVSPTSSAPTTGKGTTSWIWEHGERVEANGKPMWRCNYCPNKYVISTTSNQRTHLKSIHGIVPTGSISTNQKTIEDIVAQTKKSVSTERIRRVIAEWIIDRRHPFNEIEAKSFRKLIATIDESIEHKIPKSHNTLQSDIVNWFEQTKLIMIERLSTARSRIHLSFDLSTSPNCKALLAITAHWTSEIYKSEATLIAIRQLEEKHSGENISEWIYTVAKQYKIVNNLGYFVMDNADNNDSALKWLDKRIRQDGGKGFDPVERRLRCFGHILNLSAKDLMFEMPKKRDTSTAKENEAEEQAKWRALGAVGKAHNIAKYIRGKPQHRSAFLNQQSHELRKKLPVMDNDTRWNSTRNMCKSLLGLRDYIDSYTDEVKDLKADKLTNDDWTDLKDLLQLLEPYDLLTKLGENRGVLYGSINSTLWGMDLILTLLEDKRREAKRKEARFKEVLDAAWGKLEKYYRLTEFSNAYVVATVLDPQMKLKYFKKKWPQKWLTGVKEKVRTVYDEFLVKLNKKHESSGELAAPLERKDAFNIDIWRFGKTKVQDELDRYYLAPLLNLPSQEANMKFDLIKWWRGNEEEFPTLALIAYDIFPIPSMSVEPERVFSGYVSICYSS